MTLFYIFLACSLPLYGFRHMPFMALSNRKTPTSTSGRGTPYSASVGVDSDFAAKNSFWNVRLRRNPPLEAFVTEDSMFNFS